jgi:hypothetical protein
MLGEGKDSFLGCVVALQELLPMLNAPEDPGCVRLEYKKVLSQAVGGQRKTCRSRPSNTRLSFR